MDNKIMVGSEPADNSIPPSSKTRLIAIDDAIARIRAQIATADLERQARGRRIDARWFHRAKTALRHLQRERAEILLAGPHAAGRKHGLKDAIIAVLRERHDSESWAAILTEAQRRLLNEGC